MLVAVETYSVVLALHIAAVVVTFGVTFAYPLLGMFVTRTATEALPALHRAQAFVGQRLISPGMVVILAAGIYLAHKLDSFSDAWVQVPFAILIVIGALGGMFFGPQEKKAAALAERDLAAGGALSPEYEAVARRIAIVGGLVNVFILVAIYVMVVKPGS